MAEVADILKSNIDTRPALMTAHVLHGSITLLCCRNQSFSQPVSFFPSFTCFAYAMIGEESEAVALSFLHYLARTDHEKRASSHELRRRHPD